MTTLGVRTQPKKVVLLLLLACSGLGGCRDDTRTLYRAAFDGGVVGDTGSDWGSGPETGLDVAVGDVPDVDECVGGDEPACLFDEDHDGYQRRTDCDDTDPTIFPGSVERCDGVDNNCDGQVDNAAQDAAIVYEDKDRDGFGVGPEIRMCEQTVGFALTQGDCNDEDRAVNPSVPEICGNSVDEDCDGGVDNPHWYRDSDSDGYGDPDAVETDCQMPPGCVMDATDCDDTEALANPGMVEVCDDGIDNDCDGAAPDCDRTGELLYAEADIVIEGEWEGDRAGTRLGAGGDLNGDGKDDFAFTAPGRAFDDGRAGVVYVFSGDRTGTMVADEGLATIAPPSLVEGAPSDVAIGDVNGDGVGDLVVGVARWGPLATSSAGDVYILHGPLGSGDHTYQDGIRLAGTGQRDNAGVRVDVTGDINGDSIVDLLVVAPRADTSERLCCDEGRLFVVYGPIESSASLAESSVIIEGERTGDIGNATTVDANGDGFDDIAISGPGDRVAVFFGPIDGTISIAQADVVLMADRWPTLGNISSLKDTTGDGRRDLLIGTGQEVVVLAGGHLASSSLSDFHGVIFGSGRGASAGDFNGDGWGDIVVGSDRGPFHLFYGPVRGETDTAAAQLVLESAGEEGQVEVIPAGDPNGDGIGDLLVGHDRAHRAGAVYVYFGRGM